MNFTNTWSLENSVNGNSWDDCNYLLNVDSVYNYTDDSRKDTLSWTSDSKKYYRLKLTTNASAGLQSFMNEHIAFGNGMYLLNYIFFGPL